MESPNLKNVSTSYIDDLESLASQVVAVCQHRGWSLHWTERGAYLHLESSELIEAVRGKRGDIAKEAGDVLFVLLSILQPNEVAFGDAVDALRGKVAELKAGPGYAGDNIALVN